MASLTEYPLGRFIKSKFWKFDISTHFLCDKYHDKEKVQKKFCSNIAPSIGTGHPLNPPFLHSKTRPKYAKYVKQPKYHFRVVKMCSKGDFSQVQGGNQVYKSGLRFSFRVPEMPFLVPPQHPEISILGVSEMALPVPEMKNGDHFYRPNYPPKPKKNHLWNPF